MYSHACIICNVWNLRVVKVICEHVCIKFQRGRKISTVRNFRPFTIFVFLTQALQSARHYMDLTKGPYALLVKRQTFMPYKLSRDTDVDFPLTREGALIKIVENLAPKDIVVGTTGMLSRELYEYR